MEIQHIKRIITHWETSSFSTYRDTFEQYGG
ncbi:antimicrobial resistance protein Mig-14, partial [Salmonella enterica]|nr:antimicrobial resistance protein Mig-14 [Salmonella enterica]ECP2566756.1 antimicrobial resistance protein Mig-14 [Salmonella enterica]EDC5746112.1 antimicrobial resistance protein Mig-14 [Salmonella enterica]